MEWSKATSGSKIDCLAKPLQVTGSNPFGFSSSRCLSSWQIWNLWTTWKIVIGLYPLLWKEITGSLILNYYVWVKAIHFKQCFAFWIYSITGKSYIPWCCLQFKMRNYTPSIYSSFSIKMPLKKILFARTIIIYQSSNGKIKKN